jgi:hypothetical protein
MVSKFNECSMLLKSCRQLTVIQTKSTQVVTFQNYIQKVTIVNLGWDTSHLTDAVLFSYVLMDNTRIVPQTEPQLLLSTSIPVHYSIIILPVEAILFELFDKVCTMIIHKISSMCTSTENYFQYDKFQ